MSRGLTFEQGGFYHIYNRGTEKRTIFTSQKEYERFLALLYLSNTDEPIHFNDYRYSSRGSTSVKSFREFMQKERGRPLVDLCAYVLMPNHFHLVAHEREENRISRFMQKLLTAYTMYFNVRHERTGALFEGKFRARDANNDTYLRYLISYVHLNPIKLIEPSWKETGIADRHAARKFLESYRFSSYLEYRGTKRPENGIVSKEALPEYFQTPKDFDDHITDWLDYPEVRPR